MEGIKIKSTNQEVLDLEKKLFLVGLLLPYVK